MTGSKQDYAYVELVYIYIHKIVSVELMYKHSHKIVSIPYF